MTSKTKATDDDDPTKLVEMAPSAEDSIPKKETKDLEETNEQQDHIATITPRDEGIQIDANCSEGPKVKASPTTNSYEQEAPPHKHNYNHNDPDEKLVIAKAVPADDGHDEFYYSSDKLDVKQVATPAFEYDSNESKRFDRRRAIIVGGCILGIALVVLLTVFLLPSNVEGIAPNSTNPIEDPSFSPTLSPTVSPTESTPESIIINYFAENLSPKVLVNGTAYSMAADWILSHGFEKSDVLSASQREKLIKRYALAVFYFSSTRNGTVPWRSCNPPFLASSEIPLSIEGTSNSTMDSDNCSFLDLRSGTVKEKRRWLTGFHECDWAGVICDFEEVRGFRLHGQGIQGNLQNILARGDPSPEENTDDVSNLLLQIFPTLLILDLSFNELTGKLPASFAGLSDLTVLEIHGNSLSGEIPNTFFNTLTTLEDLNLGDNLFSGTLDTKIGELTELKGLHLHENNFKGKFPTEIGKLSLLLHSRVVGNEFSGSLPTEFGQLTNLVEFQYSNNLFTGKIPTQLGQLTKLETFRLDNNRLSGTIPTELCNLTSSKVFMLNHNKLTGFLPTTELLQLQMLVRFQVNNNQLTGPIPSQLGELPRLRQAWLHLNEFSGEVPNEVCERANIPNTGLSFLQADCGAIDTPSNPCRCCSACCDRLTEICVPTR